MSRYTVSSGTATSDLIERLRAWADARDRLNNPERVGALLDSTLLRVAADRLENYHRDGTARGK